VNRLAAESSGAGKSTLATGSNALPNEHMANAVTVGDSTDEVLGVVDE
jgi:hypothetical protein